MSQTQIKLVVAAVVCLLLCIVMIAAFDVTKVKGNQVGVKETWLGGVDTHPLAPRTYFLLPWERMFTYSTAVNVFVMNDRTPEDGELHTGRRHDSYLVQSRDAQDMHLSMQVQWRIDPEHVVTIHKTVGPEFIEERILRPTLLRVVKDEATTRDAIVAYSGDGLVKLQQDIERDLADQNGELRLRGVIVDSFVIESIRLDDAYQKEIALRQIAKQRELRAVQEEKAAQAEALKAKAMARADYEKSVVEAERDKAVKVLSAEASNEQQILAAQAEAKKVVLAAEAKKDAGELEAQAILAVGRATAESEKLKFTAYGAEGSEVYARIQVANSMSEAFKNIKGYLPEHMSVFTLGDNFLKAVENVVSNQKTATAK